jgi:putative ABC transport system permease protein
LIPLFRIDVAFNIGVDWQVMAFSIVIATVTGVACGLVPARAAVRMDLASAMKPDISGTPRRMRARHAFVIAQVATSVLLVVCALLLGRSLRNAGTIDPGFVTDDVQVMGLDLLLGGYDTSRGSVFAQTLMSRLKTLPGIEAAASARVVPLTMETEGGRVWLPQDYGDERAIAASWNFVTPGYFSTIRLPLVSGRNFDENDRAAAPAVAIVNETFASRAWPGQNPVGRHLVVGASRRPLQVIGVARDAKYRTIGEEPTSFIYVPAAQRYESIMWILIRSRGPSVIPQVRALVRELNPSLPILTAATLADMTAFGLFPQRVAAWLAGVVGIIGMLLTALGVYGLSAYNVSQRAREIGIRVALGAIRVRVVRLVVGQAMLPTVIGTMFGLIAAAVVTRLLAGMLYDIRPLDPISFAGGAIALVALTLVASFIPARRAASVNPVEVLRAE